MKKQTAHSQKLMFHSSFPAILSSETYYVSECNDGYYGDRCQNNCSSNCKSTTCNKTNGTCPGCKDGFHGDMCNLTCISNCQKCQQADGVCTKCNDGFYGDRCQNNCSTFCNSTACNKTNGFCPDCKNGYYGDMCDLPSLITVKSASRQIVYVRNVKMDFMVSNATKTVVLDAKLQHVLNLMDPVNVNLVTTR